MLVSHGIMRGGVESSTVYIPIYIGIRATGVLFTVAICI